MSPRRRRYSARRRPPARQGLTLLEAILAIAILGGAIATIGEAIRLGTLAAADARELTMAQLLCESKLAELTAGMQPLQTVSFLPLEVAPDWQYSVLMEQVGQAGLISLAVTVQRDPTQTSRPISITLYRWMIDPELAADLEADAAANAPASESSSTGGTSSGSTTSGGTGNG